MKEISSAKSLFCMVNVSEIYEWIENRNEVTKNLYNLNSIKYVNKVKISITTKNAISNFPLKNVRLFFFSKTFLEK